MSSCRANFFSSRSGFKLRFFFLSLRAYRSLQPNFCFLLLVFQFTFDPTCRGTSISQFCNLVRSFPVLFPPPCFTTCCSVAPLSTLPQLYSTYICVWRTGNGFIVVVTTTGWITRRMLRRVVENVLLHSSCQGHFQQRSKMVFYRFKHFLISWAQK